MKRVFQSAFLLTAFLGHSFLQADAGSVQTSPPPTPWLTGPLIAPVGVVVEKGHYSIQPFLFVNVITGSYNSHWKPLSGHNYYNTELEVQAIVGITKWMDFQITPAALYNTTQGQSSVNFADLPIGLDFQLLSPNHYRWFPGIKLGLLETFPTGKYDKLSPRKKGADIGGTGAFATSANLVFYKIYYLKKLHFLSMTFSFQYNVNSIVHVKGSNVYGGEPQTRGKVRPGNSFTTILSFEWTLNQNWVLALDNVYSHSNKDHFSGNPGPNPISSTTPVGSGKHPSSSLLSVGTPSSEQLSFAPAIEYNFSENLGLIAGSWFSALGRNAVEFRSGAISLVYYH